MVRQLLYYYKFSRSSTHKLQLRQQREHIIITKQANPALPLLSVQSSFSANDIYERYYIIIYMKWFEFEPSSSSKRKNIHPMLVILVHNSCVFCFFYKLNSEMYLTLCYIFYEKHILLRKIVR